MKEPKTDTTTQREKVARVPGGYARGSVWLKCRVKLCRLGRTGSSATT